MDHRDGHVSGGTAQELEFLRRERQLMEREIELLRRENEVMRATPSSTDEQHGQIKTNINAIGVLLNNFHGDTQSFSKWERQVRLLCTTYELDDRIAKLLIVSHLKDKAQDWFYATPENLVKTSEELLSKLKEMYGSRPNKLELRKKFEARTWKATESFSDYHHDKLIKAYEVPIPEEEIIDYLIESIPDHQLRNQARIQNFQSTSTLLQVFKKISLRSDFKSSTKRQEKTEGESKMSQSTEDSKGNNSRGTMRCFNCNKSGHMMKDCRQPKRTWIPL